jgi:hypothetical protein
MQAYIALYLVDAAGRKPAERVQLVVLTLDDEMNEKLKKKEKENNNVNDCG